MEYPGILLSSHSSSSHFAHALGALALIQEEFFPFLVSSQLIICGDLLLVPRSRPWVRITVTSDSVNRKTSTTASAKVFIGRVEITQPDLFNNGMVVIHGLQGFILLCCRLSSSYLIPFLSFCGSRPEDGYSPTVFLSHRTVWKNSSWWMRMLFQLHDLRFFLGPFLLSLTLLFLF